MLYKIPKEIIVYPREENDVYININHIVEISCHTAFAYCGCQITLSNDSTYDLRINDEDFKKMVNDINHGYAYRICY